MKTRIILYGTLCALLVVGGWLCRVHSSKRLLQTKTSSAVLHPQTQTVSAIKPKVASAQANPQLAASPHKAGPPSAAEVIADDRADIYQRLAAIKSINGQLTDTDREALYNFLRHKSGADDGQLGQVLKNRLLDVLCALNPPPTGLLDLLAGMYQDGSQNVVLRDYAVQHVVAYCQQLSSDAGLDPQVQSQDLAQAQKLLWQALSETGSSIAGTALLGLNHLLQASWPGVDQNKISEAALQLAGDNNAGELSRITAFQVCANLGVKDALPAVLGAAQQGETVSVQISAIGALGALGGADQVPFLNNLILGDDNRLKLPAQHALSQILFRLKQQAQAKTS